MQKLRQQFEPRHINNLAAIHHLYLLNQLYGTVLIPEAVYQALTDLDFPVAGATDVKTFDWIQTRAVSDRTLVEALSHELDIGDAEAIALAVQIQAEVSGSRKPWQLRQDLSTVRSIVSYAHPCRSI